jgi:hypothetical protein
MLVKCLISFQIFISTSNIFLKIQYFPSHIFVTWKEQKQNFKNFNVSENNVISVEDTKVVGVKGSI